MRFFHPIILGVFCLGLTGCFNRAPKPDPEFTNQVITAIGELRQHRPGTMEYWRGHEFTVNRTPVLASETVTADTLRAMVRQQVQVRGSWDAGYEWEPNEAETPRGYVYDPEEPEMMGFGIRLTSIEPAAKD